MVESSCEAGPEPLAQQPERLVRDPRHRGEDHLGSDGVGADAHRRILPAGCRPDLARACGDCPDQAVWSSTAAPGALVFSEAMPLSRPDSSAFIWLLPPAWPLVAGRLKKNLPLLAVLRSKRASSWLFLRTDSMPLVHEPLESVRASCRERVGQY